ncbi:serine protease [Aquabacterium sp.]|uniref:S1 family peptidase n=1 Tax=Aquabacterium sp. TaxID=1872578 RepID=UPI0035ADEB38
MVSLVLGGWAWMTGAQAVPSAASSPTTAPVAASAPAGAASAAPVVSASAQRLYEQARHQLVQVRTLLRGQDSQSSVGSGFFVGAEGLIITNYHVVSQVALQPQRYRLTYAGVDGRQGALDLLAFDAAHDVAVVRPVEPVKPAIQGLAFRPRQTPPDKGERIYSLGNPLDVGFAVVEGTYNGLAERGFYPTIFFSGSLNPGMSGGPALDGSGQVMGVNVATRLDGQQVSFLVPAEFAENLVARARSAKPIREAAYPELTRQLLAHQEGLTARFMAQTWRSAGHPRYKIPVPQETFMRCWGSSTPPDAKGLEYERSDCAMNQSLFVTGGMDTGNLSVRHETYDGRKLGTWRFARQYSQSFRNEFFSGGRQRTAAQCSERFVDRDGLPLRAVVCLNAYKKLPGLYDVGVLVATLDAKTSGAQGRFDARGVSFDNALKLADFYLKGYGWTQAPRSR